MKRSHIAFVSLLECLSKLILSYCLQWRYMLLLTLLSCELNFIAGTRSYGIMKAIFPHRVAFQHVIFLHQIFVFMSVAVTRVIPVLFPEPADDPSRAMMTMSLLEAITIQNTTESEPLILIREIVNY